MHVALRVLIVFLHVHPAAVANREGVALALHIGGTLVHKVQVVTPEAHEPHLIVELF